MFNGLALSEQEKVIAAQYWAAAQRIISPVADQMWREGQISPEMLRALSEENLLAPTIGKGACETEPSQVSIGLSYAALGATCSSTRSIVTVNSIVASILRRSRIDPGFKKDLLNNIRTGRAQVAFCVSEPDYGSDAYNLKGSLVDEKEGLRLAATKKWITNGQNADWFLVFARHQRGLGCVLVPSSEEGICRMPLRRMSGQTACGLSVINFNCHIPLERLVIAPGLGGQVALESALDVGRFSVAWGAFGVIIEACERALKRSATRMQFSRRLNQHDLIKRRLSNLLCDYLNVGSLCINAARLRDSNDRAAIEVTSAAKYQAAEAVTRAVLSAAAIHGAQGLQTEDTPFERLIGDARALEVIEGTAEIMQIRLSDFAYSVFEMAQM